MHKAAGGAPHDDGHVPGARPDVGARALRGESGIGPLRRLYEASEGWICLSLDSDEEWARLCTTVERDDLVERAPGPEAAADVRQ